MLKIHYKRAAPLNIAVLLDDLGGHDEPDRVDHHKPKHTEVWPSQLEDNRRFIGGRY